MTRVFVTGANGQVGSALVQALIGQGHQVHILLREGAWHPGLEAVKSEGLQVFRGSFLKAAELRTAMKGCQIVFHVAGMISYRPQDAWQMQQVNVYGTAQVVQMALELGIERLVHTSSTAALGYSHHPTQVLAESTELAPQFYTIAYLKTKRDAENEVKYGIQQGLDAVMLNPSTIFGPGDAKGNTGQLFQQLQNGLRWAPPGGSAVVSIEQVVKGHLLALSQGKSGARYVLSSLNLPFQHLFQMLADLYQGQSIQTLPRALEKPLVAAAQLAQVLPLKLALSADVMRFSFNYRYFDASKAQRELGWQPDSLAQFKGCLEAAKQWYQEVPAES